MYSHLIVPVTLYVHLHKTTGDDTSYTTCAYLARIDFAVVARYRVRLQTVVLYYSHGSTFPSNSRRAEC